MIAHGEFHSAMFFARPESESACCVFHPASESLEAFVTVKVYGLNLAFHAQGVDRAILRSLIIAAQEAERVLDLEACRVAANEKSGDEFEGYMDVRDKTCPDCFAINPDHVSGCPSSEVAF
jgi:hypothetical protein